MQTAPAAHARPVQSYAVLERYIVSCYAAEGWFAVSINLNSESEGGEVSFPEYGPRSTQTSVRSRAKSTAAKWQSGIRSARFHPALLPWGELTYMQDMCGRVIQASPPDQLGLKSSMLSTCGITGPGRSVRQSAAALQRPPELTALGNPAEPTNRRAARSTCFNGGSWC
jgi:hypothetical protein